jgi:hypothetical protein
VNDGEEGKSKGQRAKGREKERAEDLSLGPGCALELKKCVSRFDNDYRDGSAARASLPNERKGKGWKTGVGRPEKENTQYSILNTQY